MFLLFYKQALGGNVMRKLLRRLSAGMLTIAIVFTLVMVQKPIRAYAMQIFIKTSEGKNIIVEVEPTDRIEEVKKKIEAEEGILAEEQCLVFEGKVLKEGNTLQDYSIQKDSTLELFIIRIKDINLDTSYLAPSDGTWDTTNDHKVYFGKYNGIPTAFRVLKAEIDTMFLDCDTILLMKEFDEDGIPNDYPASRLKNKWSGSDLEKWLNNEDYYGNPSVFTVYEKKSIVLTKLEDSTEDYEWAGESYRDYEASDYVYLLSAIETNTLYKDNFAKTKIGGVGSWWLRSASIYGDDHASIVDNYGFVLSYFVKNDDGGVSPAFNIDLKNVLFSSSNTMHKASDKLTKVEADSSTKEWKLTLLDDKKSVKVTSDERVTQNEDIITVPFTYTGSDVSQISVMITSGEYDKAGTEILYYGKLDTTDSLSGASGSAIGTFTLPSGLTTGYKMYLLAEDVNEAKYTDYASKPTEIVPHIHVWDTNWTSDEKAHWHKCTAADCDGSVSDKAAHTESEWMIDKEATTDAEGTKHTECKVCHKVMQTGMIEKLPIEETTEEKPTTEAPNDEATTEEIPTTETPTEDKPDSEKSNNSANTGDNSNMAVPITLGTLSLILFIALLIYKRRIVR